MDEGSLGSHGALVGVDARLPGGGVTTRSWIPPVAASIGYPWMLLHRCYT